MWVVGGLYDSWVCTRIVGGVRCQLGLEVLCRVLSHSLTL